jgi:FMN phosphatase YigB (HAD superfamily)
MIKAVVLDIGSVLEVIDDAVFPEPFEIRHGLGAGAVAGASDFARDPGTGALTEAEVRAHWRERLGLSEAQADELMADYWRWYVGTLDRRLTNWFAGVRGRGLKAGILSNSGPGAREAERVWGFEEMTDDIVYSHEVGLGKPDPEVYELTLYGSAWRPTRSCSWTTSPRTSTRPAPPAGTPYSTRRRHAPSPSWRGSSPATCDRPRQRGQPVCWSWLPGITHGAQSQPSSQAR